VASAPSNRPMLLRLVYVVLLAALILAAILLFRDPSVQAYVRGIFS
jgi:hypothetical protein